MDLCTTGFSGCVSSHPKKRVRWSGPYTLRNNVGMKLLCGGRGMIQMRPWTKKVRPWFLAKSWTP